MRQKRRPTLTPDEVRDRILKQQAWELTQLKLIFKQMRELVSAHKTRITALPESHLLLMDMDPVLDFLRFCAQGQCDTVYDHHKTCRSCRARELLGDTRKVDDHQRDLLKKDQANAKKKI